LGLFGLTLLLRAEEEATKPLSSRLTQYSDALQVISPCSHHHGTETWQSESIIDHESFGRNDNI
jgi:hypothetical protein